jgi:SAM-dependent methyltransferase
VGDYVSSFGFEWTTFDRTQLGEESKQDLITKTGLNPDDVRGKRVLEAGCGVGRHSMWLAEWGAEVVAVDMSDSVYPAARNTKGSVKIVQADLTKLPLQRESFDIIISIGVLHHTPDTRESFLSLIPYVKPGGRIAIWIYATDMAVGLSPLWRKVTSRMNPRWLLRLCRLVARLYPLYQIPKVRGVLRYVLPISYHPDPNWRVLDTFDWYSPRYQWRHSEREVREWFEEAGLRDVETLAFPVSVTGIR